MPPLTTPSTFNATSSPELPCGPFEPRQRHSGKPRSPLNEARVPRRLADVQLVTVTMPAPAPKPEGLLPPRAVVVPAKPDFDQLAKLLNGGGRVTMLCGSGCAGAHDELLAAAACLQAPVVHALRGKEHVEWDNPYDVGMTGLIGFSSGYYAMLDCDVAFPVS